MRNIISIGGMVTCLLFSSQVFAHGDHGKWPCKDDVKKFCPDVKKGDHEAFKKCLDDNQDKLSDKCKAGREKMKERKKAWEAACGDDMSKLCPSVDKDDHKAMHECMKKNESKLSPKCKAEKKKMKKMHEEKSEESDE